MSQKKTMMRLVSFIRKNEDGTEMGIRVPSYLASMLAYSGWHRVRKGAYKRIAKSKGVIRPNRGPGVRAGNGA